MAVGAEPHPLTSCGVSWRSAPEGKSLVVAGLFLVSIAAIGRALTSEFISSGIPCSLTTLAYAPLSGSLFPLHLLTTRLGCRVLLESMDSPSVLTLVKIVDGAGRLNGALKGGHHARRLALN